MNQTSPPIQHVRRLIAFAVIGAVAMAPAIASATQSPTKTGNTKLIKPATDVTQVIPTKATNDAFAISLIMTDTSLATALPAAAAKNSNTAITAITENIATPRLKEANGPNRASQTDIFVASIAENAANIVQLSGPPATASPG